jgi:NADPH-dependent 2,4-dienoyl-CoA reductase/sulfur reductase-like enzyme/pSer/pThr/pTyr-binding forkhead associated (FHA) protein
MAQGARYLIIGDGAAGLTAAQKLREASPLARITILSDDPHPAYYRAALTNYLLGELTESQIFAVPPSFFYDYRVERVLARVAAVETARSQLWLTSGGQPLGYDKLLIASGAQPRPPAFEGGHLAGVATMRTLGDTRRVMDMLLLGGVRQAVIVGGGPLAIEWAMALGERKVQTTLLVRGARVLDTVLDAVGSDLVLARMRQAGIDVRTGDEIHDALPGPSGAVGAVRTKGGQTLPCQLVGTAIGVVACTYFLQESGIELNKRGAVVVDDRLRTSVPNVHAAGDVVELDGKALQLWEPARRQALVAAANMTGGDVAYRPGAHYFATRLADLDFASVGDVHGGAGVEELVDRSAKPGRIAYRKMLVKDGRLVGAMMLGLRDERVRARGRLFKQLVDERIDVGAIKRSLIDPGFDLSGWLRGRMLIQKPAAPTKLPPEAARTGDGGGAARVAATAFVRGTQLVDLKAAGTALVGLGALAQKPAGKAEGGKLTIGLPTAGLVALAVTGPRAWLAIGNERHVLAARVTLIGSHAPCQILLRDEGVSHAHAQVSSYNDDYFLQDLGSRTGTWVHGQPVTVPHLLRAGDPITIGRTTMVFGAEGGRAATPAQKPVAPATPAGAHAPARLEGRAGPCFGLRFALRGASVTVGREPGNDIRLDDISVSRRHAVLSEHGGTWRVCDMHASRGVVKNRVLLPPGQEVPLAEGDQLQLGDSVLVFTRKPEHG